MNETSIILKGFTKNWHIILIRGIFTVIFGILAIILPVATILALVLLISIYLLLDGITAIWVSISSKEWWLLVAGILSIIAGILIFFYPIDTALLLLYFIAFWAIFRGIFEFISAIRLRKEISNEWFYIFNGIVSFIFGLILIIFPLSGALAMIWVIGIYALVFGILMIIFSFRVRSVSKALKPTDEKL